MSDERSEQRDRDDRPPTEDDVEGAGESRRDQPETVVDPSVAPTVVDRPMVETRRSVSVPENLVGEDEFRDSAGFEAVEQGLIEPSGPTTLVQPSSASGENDYREAAQRLRDTWDEEQPPVGLDASVAEELGSSFDPVDPSQRQKFRAARAPEPEPPPEVDRSVIAEREERMRKKTAFDEAEQRGADAPSGVSAASGARDAADGSGSEEDEQGSAGEEDSASIEEKKERMRQYAAADRAMDSWKSSRRKGGGRMGCLTRTFLVLVLLAALGAVIWAWHPWTTEVVTMEAAEHPGICSPGVDGTKTVEYLTIFGVRVTKTGESTVCLE